MYLLKDSGILDKNKKGWEVEMLISFKMFMTVVEEMSISRAAARSFVTQQCVSDHIKRIEEEYKVILFNRRPKLSLTPAGEEMYKTLCKIADLESDLEKRLKSMQGVAVPKLTIGVNATRISIILPKLLSEYNKFFPNVIISFVIKDTRTLEQLLLKGEVDMIVDLNAHTSPQFNIISLGKDKLHFLISENLYHRYFKQEELLELSSGIKLERIKDIPIASNFEGSTIDNIIQHYAERDEVKLNILYYTGEYETQLSLCCNDLAAAICPTMILKKVLEYNKESKNPIFIFPLENQTEELKIEIVTNKGIETPEYMQKFIELLINMMRESIEKYEK